MQKCTDKFNAKMKFRKRERKKEKERERERVERWVICISYMISS
jgi:hypothetical protein